MAKIKKVTNSEKPNKIRPALTPEARENQLIYLATDLAEKQLRDGTASSQVITHYLKLGTAKERLEREILDENKKLLAAKTKALEDASDMKALYAEAIKAMKKYSGSEEMYDEESEDY